MRPDGQPHLVLIVDNDPDVRELYAYVFRLAGFSVAEATDGSRALDTAVEVLPDVILMDLTMPELQGWDAARQLRADPRTTHIGIVVVSGDEWGDIDTHMKQTGADVFLRKPCMPNELVSTVERLLAHRRVPVASRRLP